MVTDDLESSGHRNCPPRGRTTMTSPTTLICVLLLLLATWSPSNVDAGMCSSTSCLNGGKMVMPNSVFGYCRCRCPEHFEGPKCQFVTKRDPAPDPTLDRRQFVDGRRNEELRPSTQQVISQMRRQQSVLDDDLTDFRVD